MAVAIPLKLVYTPADVNVTAIHDYQLPRRTGDGIAVSCSTVTPDCQELDWHDARADTRPRDPPRVHPALQCLPTRTQAPSIAARSAPLTGRDGQAGQARCASCAWCPAPRPRPRSVCHVVVVGLVPLRLLFALPQCSWDRSQTHGFRDQIDAQTHGFRDQIDPQDSKDDSSTQGRRGSKLDASWMYSGSSSRQTGADNGCVGA